MLISLFKTLLFLLFLTSLSKQQSNINNIVFDLADLAIDYESTRLGWISIEAFKSSLNDKIIEGKQASNYGQLNWLSIGHPALVLSPNVSNSQQYVLFNFSPEGFYTRVDMLTTEQRNLFKSVVKRKYNIDIKVEQIVSLIPSMFTCQFTFYAENGEKLLITGEVKQLNVIPYRLFFSAPQNSKESVAFRKRLANDVNNLDIEFTCQVNSQGVIIKQNTLIITGKLMNQLNLVDDLFGPASETYVSRSQVTQLANVIYTSLNVIEEYQIPSSQFSDDFIDQFIQLTSKTMFENVDIVKALSNLSLYDIGADLKPSVITNELSKLLYINKSDSLEYIVLNTTQLERLKMNSNSGGEDGLDFSYGGISLGGSSSYTQSHSSDWQNDKLNFTQQLSQLNTYTQNDIEWARKGNLIVPKSINVARLAKASFAKDLVFTRIKRVYQDAPYKRAFTLNTFNGVFASSLIADNAKRIEVVEKNIAQLSSLSAKKTDISDLKVKYDNLKNDLSGKLNYQNITINSINTAINTRIDEVIRNSAALITQRIDSLDKFKVLKGEWRIDNTWTNDGVNLSFSARFNPPFNKPPTVFYTFMDVVIGDNKRDLYRIFYEMVTKDDVKITISFHGRAFAHSMIFRWVAVGY